ncbi:MAG: hypothetical protein ACRENU_09195 [Gemmatimonadaceae bacterium]
MKLSQVALALSTAVLTLPAAPLAGQQPPSSARVAMADGDHMLRAFRDRILLDTLAIWENVPTEPRRAFARVREILGALRIPIGTADSAAGVLFNTNFVTRGGQFAGKANSAWMRCGFGPTGDHADQWRVTVAYAVYVQPQTGGQGSRLGVALVGQARDIGGANSPPVFCNTKGSLEMEIVKLVRADPQLSSTPED